MGIITLVLLEGFTLFILIGRFLTVMRVTISSCIQIAMGLLCMFFLNYLLVTVYFPESWSWVIHLVVGLFLWYWHQRISEVGYRVAIMPRCILYGGLVI
jgi:hypothetical protein